jgi:hypothetical protein
MASTVDVYNMALSHLAHGQEVAATSERSAEAAACRTFYDIALRDTLRAYPWGFATKIEALDLIEEDPNDEWAYSYRYPSDCVHFRRILSGDRNDSASTRAEFKVAHDSSGQLIFTDTPEAEAEYTQYVSNVDRFPPDFMLALSYRLAALIAPRVMGGDPKQLGLKAYKMYQIELSRAGQAASSEEQPDEAPDSEFIKARG